MSVTVTLNLDTIDPDSARAVIAALNCLIGAVELAPTPNFREVSAQEAIRRPIPSQLPVGVPVSATDDPAPEVEAEAPTKRKPGRPRKVEVQEVAVEQVDPIPTTPSEKPSESEAPSLDDLRAALTTLTTVKSLSAGLALLQANGCARVSEVANLPIEAQLAFVEACHA